MNPRLIIRPPQPCEPTTGEVELLVQGIRTARRCSTRFVNSAERRGFTPKEESITDYFLSRLPESVTVRTFNRVQESRTTGADWMWWWTDGSEWFGTLVQAKRRQPSAPFYDFGYTPRPSKANPTPAPQIDTLLSAARSLGVPALYALYNHGQLKEDTTDLCKGTFGEGPWKRLAVAALPALIAQYRQSIGADVTELCKPIECLACPSNGSRVNPWFVSRTSAEIVSFLRDAETLPRRVAAGMIQQLAWVRSMQFRDFSSAWKPEVIDLDQLLLDVPMDVGHFAEPWLLHVLRGLRAQVPRWVAQVAEGAESVDDPPDGLAGAVVIRGLRGQS